MIAIFLFLSLSAQGGGEYSSHQELHGIARSQFGSSMAAMGDLDGNGIEDFAVGAPGEIAGQATGAVHLYSGATRTVLLDIPASPVDLGFGSVVANAGDINHDGITDVLVGTYALNRPGSAYVFSSADGAMLFSASGTDYYQNFGRTVSGLDDIDGDGFDDFLVGDLFFSPQGTERTGAVFAYSGRTGLILYRVDGTRYGGRFSLAISATHDLDGDGIRDFWVSEPYADPWYPEHPAMVGVVRAYSGATGVELHHLKGYIPGGEFGSAISTSGDLDQDGVNDLVVGAAGEHENGSRLKTGALYIYSGATHQLIRRLAGDQDYGAFGSRVLITPDLNGDQWPDLLVGQPGYSLRPGSHEGSVFLFSGRSQALLQRWYETEYHRVFGSAILVLGDTDGDGNQDWLVSAPSQMVYDGGVLYAHSFDPLLRADQQEISALSGGVLHLELDFPDSQGLVPYRIVISRTGVGPTRIPGGYLPLTMDPLLAKTAHGIYPPNLQHGSGFLDASGNASASFTVPPNAPAAIRNTTRWFSAMTLDTLHQRAQMVSVPVPLEILP